MYEGLIAYLLGKKEEFTDEDLDEFIDLLKGALEISEEYMMLEKQTIIESMVDKAELQNSEERTLATAAIDNILHLKDCDEEEDIFKETEEEKIPLKDRKLVRRRFHKSSAPEGKDSVIPASKNEDASSITERSVEAKDESPIPQKNKSQTKRGRELEDGAKRQDISGAVKKEASADGRFVFDIGDLDENHEDGPSFDFKTEEDS